MPKIDFASILLFIVCILLFILVFIIAITHVVDTFGTNSAEASMYSKPSWYEITTTTTTEEISSEEIAELEDEFEDEGLKNE